MLPSSFFIGAGKRVCLLEMPITPQITLFPVMEAMAAGQTG
jgi:hypothetical protein